MTSVIDWATARRVGFSHLVAPGAMADVDFGDMLDYLANDRRTTAILLYMEGVSHARKFMSAARAAARTKPVIVVKAGRHAESAKAAATHTGALAGADIVVEHAFEFGRHTAVTMEPRVVIADYDPVDDALTVHQSHQSPYQMQDVYSRHLGIPEHKVRVVCPDVGGGFGLKINVHAEELAAVAIGKLIGRPVKYCADRLESFGADCQTRDHRGAARLGVAKDGRIRAIDFDNIPSIGPYTPYIRLGLAEGMIAITSCGEPFDFSAYRGRARVRLRRLFGKGDLVTLGDQHATCRRRRALACLGQYGLAGTAQVVPVGHRDDDAGLFGVARDLFHHRDERIDLLLVLHVDVAVAEDGQEDVVRAEIPRDVDLLEGPGLGAVVLHPLVVADGDAAAVGEHVGEDRDPAVEEDPLSVGMERPVGPLGDELVPLAGRGEELAGAAGGGAPGQFGEDVAAPCGFADEQVHVLGERNAVRQVAGEVAGNGVTFWPVREKETAWGGGGRRG